MNEPVNHGRVGAAGFVVLVAVNIVSGALLIWLASNRASVPAAFPFALGAWGSYLGAHYLVEGEMVDNSAPTHSAADEADSTEPLLPPSTGQRVLGGLGLGSMVLAFPTGIVVVGGGRFLLMLLSAALFTGGYVVGHYGLTGKPL